MYRIALMLMLLINPAWAQTLTSVHVASFNIHYIVPSDKGDNWNKRKNAVTGVLKEMNADIIAFQEMETFAGSHYNHKNLQLEWVSSQLSHYKAAATGNPEVFPNTQPILYRDSHFVVEDQGFFFFSDSPDKIYSKQWDGRYPYFCSWVRFRHAETDKSFFVFNVHNDYKSRRNRLKTSELVAKRISEIIADEIPLIVVGDFNVSKKQKELRILEGAGLTVVRPNGATNRIWGLHLVSAIDHILVSREISVNDKVTVWRSRYDGIYPSDHYPISAEINF